MVVLAGVSNISGEEIDWLFEERLALGDEQEEGMRRTRPMWVVWGVSYIPIFLDWQRSRGCLQGTCLRDAWPIFDH